MNTMFRKCCSIAVGLVYVASGLLKVMDPVGTGLIVEAYLRFMHIPESALMAKILGVVLGALETTVGFAAVFCACPCITRWIILGMQSAFTLLSLALVIWNPQMHCGCFGEAIHLTHWQTFIKNIVTRCSSSGSSASSAGSVTPQQLTTVSPLQWITFPQMGQT